jgi:hypothetical protein
MYRKIEDSPHLTMHEAFDYYPDDYMLMQMDDDYMLNPSGIVFYVGDDGDELFSLQVNQPVLRGIVLEGTNIQLRHSLGGIVVG